MESSYSSQVELNSASEKTLRIPVSEFPSQLSYLSVATFFEYVLLQSLGRTLVTRDLSGKIVGDIAESWSVSSDYREFLIRIRPGQFFSDGSIIGADDVVYTLSRIRKSTTPLIHYQNPKNIIKVAKLDGTSVGIGLLLPEPGFLLKLMHPEFSIVPTGYCDDSEIENRFCVTAGAYRVIEVGDGKFSLSRNQFFPLGSSGAPAVELVSFHSMDDLENLLKQHEVNYYLPSTLMTANHHTNLLDNGWRYRNSLLGFCNFISINPRSKSLQSRANRLFVLDILSGLMVDWVPYHPFLQAAGQVFLGNGPGRLSGNDIADLSGERRREMKPFNDRIQLSFLVQERFEFLDSVLAKLAEAGIDVAVTRYSSFAQYSDFVSGGNFDLVNANNDFSAIDLLESICVTFNEHRPLIFLDTDSSIHSLIARASICSDDFERQQIIRLIGAEILCQGYAAPIYHFVIGDYAGPGIDCSALSKVEPDFRLWRILVS
jgi:MarR-like DNA-binding transcriptional regulator SgrR of sgrS sRNA